MVLHKQLLPDIKSLKKLSQSLAMLDAILSPVWEDRYYSFNSKWGKGEMMASMRNGSGDEYFIVFNQHGAIIKGFDHESPMSPYATNSGKIWPGILDGVPDEFSGFLSEPAFSMQDITFCYWRRHIDSSWQAGEICYPAGDDPDGSQGLLSILDSRADTYRDFAEEYYEKEVDIEAVEHIYSHRPLTPAILNMLNADISMEELRADMEEIGYE